MPKLRVGGALKTCHLYTLQSRRVDRLADESQSAGQLDDGHTYSSYRDAHELYDASRSFRSSNSSSSRRRSGGSSNSRGGSSSSTSSSSRPRRRGRSSSSSSVALSRSHSSSSSSSSIGSGLHSSADVISDSLSPAGHLSLIFVCQVLRQVSFKDRAFAT